MPLVSEGVVDCLPPRSDSVYVNAFVLASVCYICISYLVIYVILLYVIYVYYICISLYMYMYCISVAYCCMGKQSL